MSEKSTSHLPIHLPGKLTEVSLELPEQLPYPKWEAIGQELGRIGRSVQWWIGDWLVFGEHKYGEKYAQAAIVLGLPEDTMTNYQWVASRVENLRRLKLLTWSHHQQVAALEPSEQDRLLEAAQQNQWTVQDLRAAVREYRRQLRQPGPTPDGQYHVLYADPPWDYSNSGFEQSAASHYPTMDTDAICGLSLPDTTNDAVLFLWVTSPLLPEGLRVLAAWGFDYKATMVWLKDRAPGMGWFLNTRHELLLIGTKGSCHPRERMDSVFEAPVTRHSAKPPCVYGIIEAAYDGPYCELFLRGAARDRWIGWGNEAA